MENVMYSQTIVSGVHFILAASQDHIQLESYNIVEGQCVIRGSELCNVPVYNDRPPTTTTTTLTCPRTAISQLDHDHLQLPRRRRIAPLGLSQWNLILNSTRPLSLNPIKNSQPQKQRRVSSIATTKQKKLEPEPFPEIVKAIPSFHLVPRLQPRLWRFQVRRSTVPQRCWKKRRRKKPK